MEILLVLTTGAMCIVSFLVGAKVGQTVSKGEPIELPKVEPMKAIQEQRERKQARAEQEKYETIMRNIDKYDGTDQGQEEIPRG